MTAAGESIGWRSAVYPGRGGPADTSAARSRLPVSVVALSAATGVLVVAAAYMAGRLGHAGASWANRMYWLGQLLILTPVAARLLSRRAAPKNSFSNLFADEVAFRRPPLSAFVSERDRAGLFSVQFNEYVRAEAAAKKMTRQKKSCIRSG